MHVASSRSGSTNLKLLVDWALGKYPSGKQSFKAGRCGGPTRRTSRLGPCQCAAGNHARQCRTSLRPTVTVTTTRFNLKARWSQRWHVVHHGTGATRTSNMNLKCAAIDTGGVPVLGPVGKSVLNAPPFEWSARQEVVSGVSRRRANAEPIHAVVCATQCAKTESPCCDHDDHDDHDGTSSSKR